MRTFQYTGKANGTFVQTPRENVELRKGDKFETEDEVIAKALAQAPEVKESVDEEKKPSPKPDVKP